ncbi:NADH:flavin oxidoreductase/NADH oxidase [Hymenobacter sp. NBH84]|uniref:NADH:flavin oxidoreductase/NADH oxidase n=1 Tax=Hymenobacter sp. NBH84 TaxID=2596915 RepID=UPI0016246085|nr:NADH:flavin oxidoreductase/NADH oxidase [Hymenobacter sp. NBH84]QNE39403.1 NADH:flavin oxidoreductase/NADH oxidase [Hymenobacter sp. NBH84]
MSTLLFSPLHLRGLELKNRIVVSPMCQYSSEDGFANDWHLVHLGSRAVGGVGLIISEAAAVAPEGRITPQDLGIWKDEHVPFLKRINDFVRQQGTAIGVQLAHAGRKASTTPPWDGGKAIAATQPNGWEVVAPSALPFSSDKATPHALTEEEIQQVVADFRAAARRSLAAGFQIIEVHAAHGYLLHEFLSPLSNERNDQYGGSFENRSRLLLDVVAAIRAEVPDDYPVIVRVSATDWTEGGWTKDDSVQLARVLQANGVDLLDASTGGNVPDAKIPTGPGYQVEFAEAVKQQTGMLTGAVGIITTAQQAEDILQKGQADLVLLAREFLRDPYFPLHAASDLDVELAWPVQYERAKRPKRADK